MCNLYNIFCSTQSLFEQFLTSVGEIPWKQNLANVILYYKIASSMLAIKIRHKFLINIQQNRYIIPNTINTVTLMSYNVLSTNTIVNSKYSTSTKLICSLVEFGLVLGVWETREWISAVASNDWVDVLQGRRNYGFKCII